MAEAPTPERPTVVRRREVDDASPHALRVDDGGRVWTFLYDDAARPVASSGRVEVYRGTVLAEGESPRRAVAKVLKHAQAGARSVAVMNAGIALASGAGPAFLYSNCEHDNATVLVEEDCGVSLRDVLGDPSMRIPGPGAAKPLFPPGAESTYAAVTRKIYFDLCAHMAALHMAGHAHCDIRPGNIALRRFGPRPDDVRATLIDFETLAPLTGGFPAVHNEYLPHVRDYLGRDPLPLEMDIAYAVMALCQLERREYALTPEVVQAFGHRLDDGFKLAHPGQHGCLRDVGSRDFRVLGEQLGLVPIADMRVPEVPKFYAVAGHLDYLGCRWLREMSERSNDLVEAGLRCPDEAAARAACVDRLVELVTNCVYELREEGDGRISLARFARWVHDGAHELPEPHALGAASIEDAVRAAWHAGRLPGIDIDHRATMSLVSEQVRAKQRINKVGKERIATLAIDLIVQCVRGERDFASLRSSAPKTVFVDGGSTTQEIVEGLCELIAQGSLANVRIVTPSVRHAARLSECFMDKGFDDHYDAVSLYVAGGLVRPGTQSTISQAIGIKNQVSVLRGALGRKGRLGASRFDVAFLGASRLSTNGVVTTTGGVSLENKFPALEARSPYVVLDSTKVQDPPFEHVLTSLDANPNVRVIVDRNDANEVLSEVVRRFGERIVLA